MKDEPLIHWGVPGMKWGVRRARQAFSKAFAPKTTTKLQTGKDGKTYLVKRTAEGGHLVDGLNRKSQELSRREVNHKQVQSFLKAQKNQKVKDVIKAEKVKKAAKIVSTALSAYLIMDTVRMFKNLNKTSTSTDTFNAAYTQWLRTG